jgi:hypothetical protein
MRRRDFLQVVARRIAFGGTALGAAGCGTFLHPERSFQPHSHQIDWKIVALNSLGLILFFIPGVVAFVVDFYTGAIYLPCEYCQPPAGYYIPHPAASAPPAGYVPSSAPVVAPPIGAASMAPADRVVYVVHKQPAPQLVPLKRIALSKDELEPGGIERAVSRHIGHSVSFDHQPARLSRLTEIEQYGEQLDRHRSDRNFGTAVRTFFARLKGA